MAFNSQGGGGGGGGGFGNSMLGNTAPGQGQALAGPDLEEIQTQALGFLSVAGDSKVRLLPTPWPSDALPPPTSSLLAVASSRGLLAAAGPNALVLASTESVRQAFSSDGTEDVKAFQPQLTIPIQFRVSQVAFSADDNALVISSENGGGLAVYSVQDFERGNTQPAFEIGTNGMALRELVPNPVKERAELVAMVTVEGHLLLASLGSKQLLNGPNGPVLKERVSCVSWSKQGKQLVAGLADGAASQLTPEGVEKAQIPYAPGIPGGRHVSSIVWLENDVFLIGYNAPSDMNGPAGVQYFLVTRQQVVFGFQKMPEVCAPFSMDRSPPSQFVVRLRNFPPHIWDLLIVASTTSADLGLFSKAREPLAPDKEREKITNVFTMTTMANDSLRASVPLSEELSDTSPIGLAADLSARNKVKSPIPGEEFEESQHPIPNIMALNNEGILSSWWVMYTDSIRQGTMYPSLAVAGGVDQKLPGSEPTQTPADQPTRSSAPASAAAPASAFGQPGLAAPKLNLGSMSGSGSSPSFGSAISPGQNKSAWSTGGFGGAASASPSAPAFGQPAFGAPSQPGGGSGGGPAFGQPAGGLGARASVWGGGGVASTGGATFGQPAQPAGMKLPGPGSSDAIGAGNNSAPFGSYAQTGGFGGVKPAQPSSSPFAPAKPVESPFTKPAASPFTKPDASPFGSKPTESPFSKPANTSFSSSMDTSFGQSPAKPPTGLFGIGAEGFKIGSTFKGDGTAANDAPKPTAPGSTGFNFGGMEDALGGASKPLTTPVVREETMDEEHGENTAEQPAKPAPSPFSNVTTPPPALQPKTAPVPPVNPMFGTQAQPDVTPAAVQKSTPTSIFGVPASTTPEDTPQKEGFTPPKPAPPSPKIKTEPPSDDDATPAATPMKSDHKLQEPEPPASTSKSEYTAGDISGSSSEIPADDAPLPPDFLTAKSSESDTQPPLPDESEEEEEEEEEEDFDESGEDVTKELSPTEEQTGSLKFSPESSFGTDRTGLGGSFTKVSQQADAPKPKMLFGEIGGPSMPKFEPPSKLQESPRSPSPIRSTIPTGMLRPESSRSVSAPTRPASIIQQRIEKLGKSPLARDPTPEERRASELDQRRITQEQARRQAEQGDLTDDEDERLREELSADIEATRDLPEFVYHQDYAKDPTKEGMPGQIELLYRDINSMIDTLGINARSLQSWSKWQTENFIEASEVDENRLDIEDDDWCLDQVDEIPVIAEKMSKDLEAGRLHDIRPKVNECYDLAHSCSKLESKATALRKTFDARNDPAFLATPLSQEQASIQHDLRQATQEVQKLLVKAEQSVSILRAQLSSVNPTNGAKAPKRPTVEAVTTTIQKMTGMAEKKSVNIDLLEMQLRQLDLVANGETSLIHNSDSPNSSREQSPFQTPPPGSQTNGKRRSVRKALASSTNSPGNTSQYFTPDSTPGKSAAFQSSTRSVRASGANFRASVDREDTPSRRLQRVSVSEEPAPGEKARYREKLKQRKEALGKVKEALAQDSRGVQASVEG